MQALNKWEMRFLYEIGWMCLEYCFTFRAFATGGTTWRKLREEPQNVKKVEGTNQFKKRFWEILLVKFNILGEKGK